MLTVVLLEATSPPASPKGGVDTWALLSTIFGAIAALAVVSGFVYWIVKRGERKARALREQQVSKDVAEMGDSIGHLESVVAALAEEMHGRAPRPLVRFSLHDGPSISAVVDKAPIPTVDLASVIELERRAALSTLLPLSTPPRERGPSTAGPVTVSGFQKLAESMRGLGFGQQHYLPVTEEDHRAFEKSVEGYCASLKTFVDEWVTYLRARKAVVVLGIQVDNDGGAPAEDARIKLHFPDPFTQADWPEKPTRPQRPKFTPRENPAWSLGGYPFRVPYVSPLGRLPDIEPPNLTGPFYEEGSVVARYDYRSLPHHDAVKPDPLVVAVSDAGAYVIRWTVGARNLPQRVEGTLDLEIRHLEAEEAPVKTLADLLNAGRAHSRQ
jgi:hypothetical protein